jgi:hypothetical protein
MASADQIEELLERLAGLDDLIKTELINLSSNVKETQRVLTFLCKFLGLPAPRWMGDIGAAGYNTRQLQHKRDRTLEELMPGYNGKVGRTRTLKNRLRPV